MNKINKVTSHKDGRSLAICFCRPAYNNSAIFLTVRPHLRMPLLIRVLYQISIIIIIIVVTNSNTDK